MSIKVKDACLWIIVFQIIGYCLSMISQHDIVSWYPTLHKSTLTPPDIVFPIVWFILYCILALSGYALWQYRHHPKAKLALVFYVLQILLNWAWTPLFFYFHWIGVSLFCIAAMIILTLITILITRKTYKVSCLLLIPYFIWLLFAGYLNAVIWILNAS
ncbi:MAG: TspO/MBR family protein [Legionellaceae bacterium]|nr:TspO/MBR family protein [Legionellaceae bacterium]